MEIEQIVIIVLIISSFLVNISVITVLAYHWSKLLDRDLIVLSLAILNLIESTIGYPYLLVDYKRNPVLPPSTQCVMSAFIVTATSIATISHIVMLSIEMYIKLKSASLILNQRSKQRRGCVFRHYVLPCWMYGLLWGLMPFLGWSYYGKETKHGYRCSMNLREKTINVTSYNVGLFVGAFVLPIAIVMRMYVGIAKSLDVLRKNAVITNGSRSYMEKQTRKQYERSFFFNACTMCLFVVVWAPYSACVIAMIVFGREPSQTVLTLAAVMAKTSSLYNSLIYTIVYKQFRCKLRNTWNKIVKTLPH